MQTDIFDFKAINLYHNFIYDVFTFKEVLYLITEIKSCPYIILTLSNLSVEDIEEYHRYSYYVIDNKLYDSFYTNNYKVFALKPNKPTIFDYL